MYCWYKILLTLLLIFPSLLKPSSCAAWHLEHVTTLDTKTYSDVLIAFAGGSHCKSSGWKFKSLFTNC